MDTSTLYLGPIDDRTLACEPIDEQRAEVLQPSDRVARLASFAIEYLPWWGGSADAVGQLSAHQVQDALTPATRDLLALEAMAKGTPEWMDDAEAESLVIEILNEYLERIGFECVQSNPDEGTGTVVIRPVAA